MMNKFCILKVSLVNFVKSKKLDLQCSQAKLIVAKSSDTSSGLIYDFCYEIDSWCSLHPWI